VYHGISCRAPESSNSTSSLATSELTGALKVTRDTMSVGVL